MKIRLFAFTIAAVASAAAWAAEPSLANRPLKASEVVRALESRYPGDVAAIAFDANDKRPHYHVDMDFGRSGMARLDVDAVTLDIAGREPADLAAGTATLSQIVALVSERVPGRIVAAELDAIHGVPAHYDVDVSLATGALARLKVDAATREIGWRHPAVVVE